MASQSTSICIVGAGVVGLSTAHVLSEHGYTITVIARDLPGDHTTDWASPWAGALLAPHPEGDVEMQKRSLEYWKKLSKQGPSLGLQPMPITEYYDDRDRSSIWYKNHFLDFEFIELNLLPHPARIGFKFTTQAVNPIVFLPWLSSELSRRGVKFIRRQVDSLEQASRLSGSRIIVNASGVGAAHLARDDKVYPVRGQTMFVKSSMDSAILYQGSQYTYVIPRMHSGGVILGGVSQPRTTSTAINPETRIDILNRVNRLTHNAFSWVNLERDVEDDIVGFRPFREGGIRVERERNVIHAYGAGGLGYLYCFGMAKKVCDLVQEQLSLHESRL